VSQFQELLRCAAAGGNSSRVRLLPLPPNSLSVVGGIANSFRNEAHNAQDWGELLGSAHTHGLMTATVIMTARCEHIPWMCWVQAASSKKGGGTGRSARRSLSVWGWGHSPHPACCPMSCTEASHALQIIPILLVVAHCVLVWKGKKKRKNENAAGRMI
jgi:hypothetical protein